MDDREITVLLSEYERAQDLAQHSDAVFWEITAIIWGANTLLLGFMLEAIDHPQALSLIVTTAMLGVVLNILVLGTYYSSKVGQRIAFDTCLDIEKRLPTFMMLHTRIDRAYPRRFIRGLIWLVTFIFIIAWVLVGRSALGNKGALLVLAALLLGSLVLLIVWILGLKRP